MRQAKEKQSEYPGDHHIVPKSRGGKRRKDNLYPRERWGEAYGRKHKAAHTLVDVLKPQEFIDVLWHHVDQDGKIAASFFAVSFAVDIAYVDGVRKEVIREVKNRSKWKQRKAAWEILFEELNVAQAIEWIEREFIRKEWLPEILEREKERRRAQKRKRRKKS